MKIRDLINIIEAADSPGTLRNVTVYVDMDGVLVDTNSHIAKLLNVDHHFKLDGNQWEDFFKNVDGYNFFRSLPISQDATGLLKIVSKFTDNIVLLTSPLNYDVNGSIRGKQEWLDKHNFNLPVIFESAKQKYAVSNNLPNVLIDDSSSQLNRWRSAGGIAIKYFCDIDDLTTITDGLETASKQIQQNS